MRALQDRDFQLWNFAFYITHFTAPAPKGCSPLSLVSVAGTLLPAAVTKICCVYMGQNFYRWPLTYPPGDPFGWIAASPAKALGRWGTMRA